MEIPPWMLALGAGGIGAPGIWAAVKWLIALIAGRRDASRAAESARVAGLAEREERISQVMEQALARLDKDVQRLSANADKDRDRIVKLERENRTLRGRLDSLVRRLHDLIAWEQAGYPPPPPHSMQSLADLLDNDRNE